MRNLKARGLAPRGVKPCMKSKHDVRHFCRSLDMAEVARAGQNVLAGIG